MEALPTYFMIEKKIALSIIAIFLLAGCIGQSGIKKSDTISLDYTLNVDGQVVDSSAGKQPLIFTVGSGQVIPGFDNGVIGMNVGEEKTFSVSPEEGYGTSGNHPLAGKTLVFTVKILKVTSAR